MAFEVTGCPDFAKRRMAGLHHCLKTRFAGILVVRMRQFDLNLRRFGQRGFATLRTGTLSGPPQCPRGCGFCHS